MVSIFFSQHNKLQTYKTLNKKQTKNTKPTKYERTYTLKRGGGEEIKK
jgi:hypothetical protein